MVALNSTRTHCAHAQLSRNSRIISIILVGTIICWGPTGGRALRFYLHDRERRCFKFDAHYGSHIIGHRSIANGKGNAELSIEVKSLSGKVIFENHSGDPKDTKFSFNTPEYYTEHPNQIDEDEYEYDPQEVAETFTACLVLTLDAAMHTGSDNRAVSFWIRTDSLDVERGSERHASEDTVGKVHTLLQQMEVTFREMIMDLEGLKRREKRLVSRSEATGRQLRLFAIVGIVVVVGTSSLQFLHFKSFFKTKKLI